MMTIGVEVDMCNCNECSACFDYLPGIGNKIKSAPSDDPLQALFDPRERNGQHDMKIGAAIANCPCGVISAMEVDLSD